MKKIEKLPQEITDHKKIAFKFHKWMNDCGWNLHSSHEYYYRSENFHQWPPDETADEEELWEKFLIYQALK